MCVWVEWGGGWGVGGGGLLRQLPGPLLLHAPLVAALQPAVHARLGWRPRAPIPVPSPGLAFVNGKRRGVVPEAPLAPGTCVAAELAAAGGSGGGPKAAAPELSVRVRARQGARSRKAPPPALRRSPGRSRRATGALPPPAIVVTSHRLPPNTPPGQDQVEVGRRMASGALDAELGLGRGSSDADRDAAYRAFRWGRRRGHRRPCPRGAPAPSVFEPAWGPAAAAAARWVATALGYPYPMPTPACRAYSRLHSEHYGWQDVYVFTKVCVWVWEELCKSLPD